MCTGDSLYGNWIQPVWGQETEMVCMGTGDRDGLYGDRRRSVWGQVEIADWFLGRQIKNLSFTIVSAKVQVTALAIILVSDKTPEPLPLLFA